MSGWGIARLAGIRIVIVEDNNDVRTTLTGYLESKGAQVLASRDAFQGIETIRDERPDLVLCDIGLPGSDGFQLLRWIRGSAPEEGGSVPVIAMTALGRQASQERTRGAGFQAHLPKPFTPDQLLQVISALLPH
jgi:CheY-like chemotaxis protein